MSRTSRPAPRPARVGRRIARAAGAALIAAVAATSIASPALAHDELVDRTVTVDPSTGTVDDITLTFSDSIIEVGTEIVVTGSDGADATDGEPQVSGPRVVQPLAADLPDGDYAVAWRVVSSDGHPIEGSFTLQAAGADSAILEADPRFEDGASAASDASEQAAEHDHAAEGEGSEGGAPVGALIAVIVGGAAVIAGGLAAATAGRKRRARGMAADTERTDGAGSAAQGEEDRA
ncbi:copper resistance CopC family protein [Leucobacter ruminantium]|uniref:Copper resistance protein CopC n=1 Tax=Leucobacter ruminantium TaxID=1289170 RepID=A0A939LYI9_9MICO|nr:copper resistance CopC family protein [Leucobacter ruminantium]MBO1803820.1 copper resistance protein CopC [Leucobacter ruminantium]